MVMVSGEIAKPEVLVLSLAVVELTIAAVVVEVVFDVVLQVLILRRAQSVHVH